MNVRNAKYNEAGSVDCEIEHPTYGWIPFTAIAGDPNSDVVLAEITAKGIVIAPKPTKTPAELEKEASDLAKASIAKVSRDTLPDLLAFVAGLSGAPKALTDAAALIATEKAKVKA